MPVVTGQNTGYINAAAAGANFVQSTGSLAAGATFTTNSLETPGLSSLTWLLNHTAGVDAALVQPQVAFRRGAANALEWVNIAPAFLVGAGTTATFAFNTVVCQAMRATIVHTGGGGQPVITVACVLSASA